MDCFSSHSTAVQSIVLHRSVNDSNTCQYTAPTATAALYSGSDHLALIRSDTRALHSSVRSKDRVSIFSLNSGSSHLAFNVADILKCRMREEEGTEQI